MKKFFGKYDWLLPVFAVLYGMYLFDSNYLKVDELPYDTLMERMNNGWGYLGVIFVLIASAIIYQLQENQKWEYIYSFPMKKQDIYKEMMGYLHIAVMAAGIIYGIMYGVRCAKISSWDAGSHIVAAAVLTCLIFWLKCMLAEILLLVFRYIWQGILAVVIGEFMILPVFLGNLGYILQKLTSSKDMDFVWQQTFCSNVNGLRVPLEINYELFGEYGIESKYRIGWGFWSEHYMLILGIAAIVILILFLFFLWTARRIYCSLDLSQKRILTRMNQRQNECAVIGISALYVFHGFTNCLMLASEGTEQTFYAAIVSVVWAKQDLGLTIEQAGKGLEGPVILLLLALIIAACTMIVWIIQRIRRKIYAGNN